jgi:photosystem II stability/assembly factor-like uncharacterized protein
LRLTLPTLVLLFIVPALLLAEDSHWERIGPSGGMAMTLEASSAGGPVYLGTADGHVFVSSDAAKHWELRGRVGSRTDTVISRLLADAVSPDIVYAAVWYQQPGLGGGVFRSNDAGWTWKLIGLEQEAVRALEVATAKPLVLIAGTRAGVFRFALEGQTWERISPPGDEELRNVDSIAVDPQDANIIYAGTYHLPWKTNDAGKTWKPVTAGLIDDSDIMSLRVDATNPERLFLSACSGIYRSENKGAQWTKLQGIPYAARRTHSIVQDPQRPQTLYAATTEGLWLTRDAGETWKRTTTKDWVVNSVMVLRAGDPGSRRVILGTEAQGILVSEDAGESFTSSNDGFTHQVVKQFIGDPRDRNHLLMVIQQNGPQVLESRDAGHTWAPVSLQAKQANRKSSSLAADSVDGFYGSPVGWVARLQNGQLWLLEEQAGTWRELKLRVPASGKGSPSRSKKNSTLAKGNLPEKILSEGTTLGFSLSNAFVPSQKGLLQCDWEGNCAPLKAFGHLDKLTALHVSADGSVLNLVADGRLAVSHDAGQSASWRDLPLSPARVLWIDCDTGSATKTIFIGTSEGLYSSADEGNSWILEQRGLPAGQTENWLRSPHFMAASLREGGLYVSTDDGKSWQRLDRDAERSRFAGLVETGTGILAMGSQSEGVLIWKQ